MQKNIAAMMLEHSNIRHCSTHEELLQSIFIIVLVREKNDVYVRLIIVSLSSLSGWCSTLHKHKIIIRTDIANYFMGRKQVCTHYFNREPQRLAIMTTKLMCNFLVNLLVQL